MTQARINERDTYTVWLSEHLDTAHSRTLKSCDGWVDFLFSARRWLEANGGLVDYYCPRTGDTAVYNLQDILDRS